jgi:hypothetical protein
MAMAGYQTKIQFAQGGGTVYFTDGSTMVVESGAVMVTADGVGAKNGAAITATEYGDGAVHKTVLTLVDLDISMVDSGANGGHGSHKIYDFPDGAIQVLGASYNLTTARVSTGLATNAAIVGAIGSTATATDNATLTTTEADVIASTTGTLTSGAGTLKKYGSLVAAAFDGTTTALDLYLNAAVVDAGISATDTLRVNGTITLMWANLGDF